jgi:hypothetical protein
MKSTPNSASAADDTTALITFAMFGMAPLLGGYGTLLDK